MLIHSSMKKINGRKTRTQAFEAAFHRLKGRVIQFIDKQCLKAKTVIKILVVL
jgi:hypothetical protein